MTRSTEEDNALRSLANKVIDAFNETRVKDGRKILEQIWQDHFFDGRVYINDRDVMEALIIHISGNCSDDDL